MKMSTSICRKDIQDYITCSYWQTRRTADRHRFAPSKQQFFQRLFIWQHRKLQCVGWSNYIAHIKGKLISWKLRPGSYGESLRSTTLFSLPTKQYADIFKSRLDTLVSLGKLTDDSSCHNCCWRAKHIATDPSAVQLIKMTRTSVFCKMSAAVHIFRYYWATKGSVVIKWSILFYMKYGYSSRALPVRSICDTSSVYLLGLGTLSVPAELQPINLNS